MIKDLINNFICYNVISLYEINIFGHLKTTYEKNTYTIHPYLLFCGNTGADHNNECRYAEYR